ncbi:hypothetical protein RZS08_06770, partial [Arthrospira platensis SPKY1]|nr:hypothetical protein [Arthrospira platensis SPKY1]
MGLRDEGRDVLRAVEDMRRWRDTKNARIRDTNMQAVCAASGLTKAAMHHGVKKYREWGKWPRNWLPQQIDLARRYVE